MISFSQQPVTDFDGHLVDFEELMSRQRIYVDDERAADVEVTRGCTCHL